MFKYSGYLNEANLKSQPIVKIIVSSVKPLYFPTIVPFAPFLHPFFRNVSTNAMLLPSLPLPNIFAAVGPQETPMAIAFVVRKFALISLSVLPGKDALSVHFVSKPLAFVGLSVRPKVVTSTRNFVLVELTLVVTTVSKGKLPVALFFSVCVVSLVASAIWPLFDALSVLFII